MKDTFEQDVQRIAQSLPYPPTPEITLKREHRTPNWQPLARAAVLLLVLGIASMAVSPIRAAILDFFQIGAVRVQLADVADDGRTLYLSDLTGETTLQDAQAQVGFTLYTPPNNPPDHVFVQDSELVIFVWLEGRTITQALYQINQMNWFITKSAPTMTPTDVDGMQAFWFEYGHPVTFERDGELVRELTHFVEGNVLVWNAGNTTYRLETNQSLDAARIIAASLVPVE